MGMPTTSELQEALCDRIVLLQEASGLPKGKFAERIGLTPPQFTNIKTYRNPPSHDVISAVSREFGVPTEWLYFGSMVGFRDPLLADRLRQLGPRPSHTA